MYRTSWQPPLRSAFSNVHQTNKGFYLFSPLSARSRCPVLVSAELSQALMTTFPEWRPFFFGMWRSNLTKFSFLDVVQFCSSALLLLMWALRQYGTIGHRIIRVSIFLKISFICWCCAKDTCEPEDLLVFSTAIRSKCLFYSNLAVVSSGSSVSQISIFKWDSNVSCFMAATALIKAVCKNQIFSLIGHSRLCKQWNVSRPSWQEEAWWALGSVAVWQRWMCVCRAGLAALLSPPPPFSSPISSCWPPSPSSAAAMWVSVYSHVGRCFRLPLRSGARMCMCRISSDRMVSGFRV